MPTEWDTTWREMLLHGVVHDESAYANLQSAIRVWLSICQNP
ncbi:hypothetical protein [Candidatus Viridilinea mediisalina]|nr:hypothetical protein [Candidatus Viridilinea mediisalina]